MVLKIQFLSRFHRMASLAFIIIGVFVLGYFISCIHLQFPETFIKPAAYPYFDSFTTIVSIVASVWMARRIIESWVLWFLVDIVAIALYYLKGIKLVSIEYFIFLGMSIYGFIAWWKEYKEELKEQGKAH